MSAAKLPPVLYVPCHELGAEGERLVVDVRHTADGRTALLVYSALDRLVDCCGPAQPWAVVPTAGLDDFCDGTGFDVIFLDMMIPLESRRAVDGAR